MSTQVKSQAQAKLRAEFAGSQGLGYLAVTQPEQSGRGLEFGFLKTGPSR